MKLVCRYKKNIKTASLLTLLSEIAPLFSRGKKMMGSLVGVLLPRTVSITLLVFGILAVSTVSIASGRFSQLVLAFEDARNVEISSNVSKNTINLLFEKTSPEELGALDLYDERLIKRVLIKDFGTLGTEVRLVLKDRDVRVSINKHEEPFRVVIDLFDYDYSLEKDPKTGLPLVGIGAVDFVPALSSRNASGRVLHRNPGGLLHDLASESTNPELMIEGGEHYESRSSSSTSGNSRKRRLLQPTPESVTNPGELVQLMEKTKQGRAKYWAKYPPYVYPLQTAAYEGRKPSSGWIKTESTKALSSAQSMAEYAYKLFSFGHEGRALLAYQQVLHRDPSVFAKDALHLWAFAEVHFAHGNLTLAVGYYDTLIAHHPESPLAKFAALRKLDNAAIKILKSGAKQELPKLLVPLSRVHPGNSAELQAQIAIRKAYWSADGITASPAIKYLPKINEEVKSELSYSYSNVESQKTAFLATSVLLKYMTDIDRPWSINYGKFANQYFKKFKGPSAEPYASELKALLKERLARVIVEYSSSKNYSAAVRSFEALPKPLQSVRKDKEVSWALAEAYRNEGLFSKSLALYKRAAKTFETGARKFRAFFWTAVTAEMVADKQTSSGNKSRLNGLRSVMRRADKDMAKSWEGLNDDEKSNLNTAYKTHFEKVVIDKSRLRTPPHIVLESWSKGLSSRINGTNGTDPTQWEENYTPSASSVYLLDALAQHFKETGQKQKRRETVRVLQAIKPSEIENDDKARKIWTDELLSLADDYRKANNYLEAGRLYIFAASNSPDVENRAETLYKGGLLLYRSGQRKEAIKAFTSASEDGDNLFYANLSKERLSQLQE